MTSGTLAGEGGRERAGEGFEGLFKKKTISFYFSPGKRTYVQTKLSLQFQGLRGPLKPILESATKFLSADAPDFQVWAWLRSPAAARLTRQLSCGDTLPRGAF